MAAPFITNTLHAANKPYSHFHLFYEIVYTTTRNLPILNQSGSMLDLLQAREENRAVQLHTEAILYMADCVYTVNICNYGSFDATMLMTSSPNITQLECN